MSHLKRLKRLVNVSQNTLIFNNPRRRIIMNLSKEKIQEILQKEIILDRKHFAYLSLTHKNELNFRDILVLYLQDKYEK